VYISIVSTSIFVYGAGPFTIAGNGSLNLHRLPTPLVNITAFVSLATLAYVLSRTAFNFNFSKMPKWNMYIMYPLVAVLSIWVASFLLMLLWAGVTLAALLLT
jgi:hypothetical protein